MTSRLKGSHAPTPRRGQRHNPPCVEQEKRCWRSVLLLRCRAVNHPPACLGLMMANSVNDCRADMRTGQAFLGCGDLLRLRSRRGQISVRRRSVDANEGSPGRRDTGAYQDVVRIVAK